MAGSTPIAVVENASVPRERRLSTRLDCLVRDIATHEIASPAIMVIGEVAGSANSLMQPDIAATVDAQA
jgi:siroheme synthase